MTGLRLHRHRIVRRRHLCRRGGTAAIGTVGRDNAFILPNMIGGGGWKRMTMTIVIIIAAAAVEGGKEGGVEVTAEEE